MISIASFEMNTVNSVPADPLRITFPSFLFIADEVPLVANLGQTGQGNSKT